ncbi:MAG: MerR family DNA-binding transcriptional regulator [Firmicutes bacterium]|uniref:MerR family transcriptional regulator n=1 Tax=Sulfobacillus benefaciens TaxID=453960 RepID=A0A2T2X4H1_9FIRM|nr:MerR family DNA-binding transcriptional regulator [Bacillota bacterium]MCL5013715.1 MerR family DNA-binding transcriptional regulator [Bacillota bacterium]PSR29391.1 MAG: MerR family transcriptional regulator [Sulfobacillus benefaciens]HBQ95004.1 MerR family transcriptional regulator [Sulfobacillus sp.]
MSARQSRQGAKLYSISELSELYDITSRTLRHYEDMGLLLPERRGQQRFYRERDRVRLQLILRGRRLGFGLREIQEMLDLYDADPTEITQLQEVIRRGDAKLQELQSQVEELQTIIAEIIALRTKMERRLQKIKTGRQE